MVRSLHPPETAFLTENLLGNEKQPTCNRGDSFSGNLYGEAAFGPRKLFLKYLTPPPIKTELRRFGIPEIPFEGHPGIALPLNSSVGSKGGGQPVRRLGQTVASLK